MQAKHPSGFNKLYIQHLNGYDKATYKISFFPDECFARKWRLKFQVSKYRLGWNAENMTSSIMSPQNYTTVTVFTSILQLEMDYFVLWRWHSQLATRASKNYNINNYYIRHHLDASWFSLHRGSFTNSSEVKISYNYPHFFRKINFTTM